MILQGLDPSAFPPVSPPFFKRAESSDLSNHSLQLTPNWNTLFNYHLLAEMLLTTLYYAVFVALFPSGALAQYLLGVGT